MAPRQRESATLAVTRHRGPASSSSRASAVADTAPSSPRCVVARRGHAAAPAGSSPSLSPRHSTAAATLPHGALPLLTPVAAAFHTITCSKLYSRGRSSTKQKSGTMCAIYICK